MTKLSLLTALAAALALRAAPGADAASSTFVNTGNAGDGLLAYHVFGSDAANRGYSLDYGTTSIPGWGLGLDTNYGDFYLFNYYYPGAPNGGVTDHYSLRLRGDTGQVELGANVPHPGTQQQVNITAGTSAAALSGIGVGTYGNSAGLYLYQISGTAAPPNPPPPPTLRTQIALDGVYAMGTDSANNNGADWWLSNSRDQHMVMTASPTDLVSINYGATINGTTTVNGPASLLGSTTTIGNTGALLGFYGGTPQTKPVITGCRCDGTALANLLQKLQAMGLITDQTTP
jgi:hypothetical protein